MAALVSKSAFARLCGVSPAAITQAIARGDVVVGEFDKIDPDHPINKAYLAGKLRGERRGPPAPSKAPAKIKAKPKAKKPKRIRRGRPPDVVRTNGNGSAEAIDEVLRKLGDTKQRKAEADIRRVDAVATRTNVDTAKTMERLIERDIMQQYAGALGAELKIQLVQLPKTITPQIVALVKSGADQVEIVKDLEDQIADAIRRSKEAAKRATLKAFADALD